MLFVLSVILSYGRWVFVPCSNCFRSLPAKYDLSKKGSETAMKSSIMDDPKKKEITKKRHFSFRINIFFFVTFLLFSVLIVRLAILTICSSQGSEGSREYQYESDQQDRSRFAAIFMILRNPRWRIRFLFSPYFSVLNQVNRIKMKYCT